MDGIEATKKIRALGTEYAVSIPVIALTANAISGNEQKFLDEGFQAFLSKPINMAKLDAVLKEWIVGGEQSPDTSGQPGDSAQPADSDRVLTVEIPGVNAKLGLSLYEDDMEMYVDILRSYAENTPSEIEKLRGLAEETLADYAIDIHTMKGVNSTIGAKEMTQRAKKMEKMAKDGDFAGVFELNEEFIKDSVTLVKGVEEWLDRHG